MSFLEGLGGAGGGGLEGITRSELGQVVRQGLGEGLSANTMLKAVQEAGAGIRRADFLTLVREVKASTEMAGTWGALETSSVPDVTAAVEWHGGTADTYLHRIYLYVRETGEDGLGVYRKAFDVVSSDLLSPDEAMARANDIFETGMAGDNYSDQQLLGMELGGIYHQVGAA